MLASQQHTLENLGAGTPTSNQEKDTHICFFLDSRDSGRESKGGLSLDLVALASRWSHQFEVKESYGPLIISAPFNMHCM